MKMSKTLFLFGTGHGGENPDSGKYVTAGKRSPKHNGKTLLFEGVNNRINVNLIIEGMKKSGLDAVDIVNDWRDISLNERARRVNEIAKSRPCVYIDIHSDGMGNGREWHSASGIGVYKYIFSSSKSDFLAKYLRQELTCNFTGISKDRGIRKKNFHSLRETSCPACLLELGFHTNLEETKLMLSDNWRSKVVKSIVDACSIYEMNH